MTFGPFCRGLLKKVPLFPYAVAENRHTAPSLSPQYQLISTVTARIFFPRLAAVSGSLPNR